MTARTLTLVRTGASPGDETSVPVAEVTVFSDGFAVLHWLPGPGGRAGRGGRARRGFEIYPDEADLRQARGQDRLELREDRPQMPDGVRYDLLVAADRNGVTSPDGSGDRTAEVATLAEAIAYLVEAAGSGCEYACLEILRKRPQAPPGPSGRTVTLPGGMP